MYEDIFLSFRERIVLLISRFKNLKLKNRRTIEPYATLIDDYHFLIVCRYNNKPPVLKITDEGRRYCRYLSRRLYDKVIIPVITSIITTILLNLLLLMWQRL